MTKRIIDKSQDLAKAWNIYMVKEENEIDPWKYHTM